jgi:FkbM family methyltransferase
MRGNWEPPLAELLRIRLTRGSRFLDVGAFVGYFTILASKLIGPTGHVVAVEPDHRNLVLLQANLKRNDCSNVRVLPLSAWDSQDDLWLSTNPENRGGSTVHDDRRTGDTPVPAAPLDTLLDGRFDLIKVDAEGSDHIALSGARCLLARCPVAVVEFWPETPVSGRHPREILDCYEELGRTFALLDEAGRLRRTTADALLASGPGYVELALLPRPRRLFRHRRLRLSGGT